MLKWKDAAKKWRRTAIEYEAWYGPLGQADDASIKRILASLHAECGRKYRGKHARDCVRRLLKSGFSEADIILVNSHMSRKWKQDQKMCAYLRPSTLYAPSKFEGYLNDAIMVNAPLGNDPYRGARVL